jgi:hypothetical protein
VADAEWIAYLLRHGLLLGSFIPSAQQRALRDLTRFRTSLVNDGVRAVNRLQKTLEDGNIKLASVVTDVTGVSGRAILSALVAGQTDPHTLADLAKGQLRKKTAQLGLPYHRGKKQRSELSIPVSTFFSFTFVLTFAVSPPGHSLCSYRKRAGLVRLWRKTSEGIKFNHIRRENPILFIHSMR